MNPAKMSTEAERVLEWMNLALGTYCLGFALLFWITSPRPAIGDAPIVAVLGMAEFAASAFLLVTSTILLFTNRRRAALAFFALPLSIIALSQSSVVTD